MAEDTRDSGIGSLLRTYVPQLVYGSNDGLITTFAIVAGVVGASLSNGIVITLGLASLFADGFSMAASAYLSERSRPDEDTDRRHSAKRGVATLVGFLVVGAVPLFAYLLPIPDGVRFPVAVVLTLITLFAVGSARTFAAERIGWVRGGGEMLAVGALAAAVAYAMGSIISGLDVGSV
jgi:vacuolar iron transporter family protein